MFSFLISAALYWLFCIAWFAIIQKPLFGLYNRRESSSPLTLKEIAAVYRHGLPTDAIIASYLTAIPLLIFLASSLTPAVNARTLLIIYNSLIGLALGLLCIGDTLLYRFWKYKIDASVFAYMRSAKGATASVSTAYLITALLAWILLSATFIIPAILLPENFVLYTPNSILSTLLSILLTLISLALLFVIIRGLGIRPNTPSIAYFSTNQYLNHWALNPAYSMIYSLSHRESFGKQFVSMPDDECRRLTDAMFSTAGEAPVRKLLRTDRPDIMLIVWESFGAEFSAAFGGREGICENFDRLAAESIRFSRCTAGSFRTDRGLVNILSGYPAQPTTSIIQHTRLLPRLPGLARRFRELGYTTEAIHGGDLTIMHKNDYYLASGHDRLIDQKAFPTDAPKGKWGYHDDPAMQLAASEAERLHSEDKPFFITLQTLSSHEPFDVPERIHANTVDNAFAYTDMALGRLARRLSSSAVWENLLLIVVADHGFNGSMLPDNRLNYSHIPLLMAGGAIKSPAEVDTIMSQTDIAATLLSQLGLPHDDFTFSRDILAPSYTDRFALHIFNNGIMIADAEGYTAFDTLLDRVIEGSDSPERIARARAILQRIYQDLDKR